MTTRKTPKKSAPSPFGPRIVFNWGFHDAAADSRRGSPRAVVESSPHNLKQVSPEFDRAFYEGYKAGLAAFAVGTDTSCSEGAWVASGLKDPDHINNSTCVCGMHRKAA